MGAGSWCSANSSWCRNGSSTASVICSIWLVEAADVVVGDVGHLFEHELLDLGPGQLLEQQARPRSPSAACRRRGASRRCSASASSHTRSSSARPTISARVPSSRTSLRVTTSPVTLAAAGQHDVERLVEHDLGPRSSVVVVELGVQRHPHLAAAGEHVDGAVVVAAEQRAVGGRRLGELVDLFAQRGDVLARLAQGVGQLLVLGHGLGELALGLEQALLERAHALGRVLQPAPQRRRPPPRATLACSRSSRQLGLVGARAVVRTRSRPRGSPPCCERPVAGRYLGTTAQRRHADATRSAVRGRRLRHALISPAVRRGKCRASRTPISATHPSTGRHTEAMKVWIDQDLCTGDGLCEEIAPTCSPCSTTASPTSRKATRSSPPPRATRGRRGPGRRPRRPGRGHHRVRRGVPRRVHLHRSLSDPHSRGSSDPAQRKQRRPVETLVSCCTGERPRAARRWSRRRPQSGGRARSRTPCRPPSRRSRTTGAPESPGRSDVDEHEHVADDALVVRRCPCRRLARAPRRRTAPRAGRHRRGGRRPRRGHRPRLGERQRGHVEPVALAAARGRGTGRRPPRSQACPGRARRALAPRSTPATTWAFVDDEPVVHHEAAPLLDPAARRSLDRTPRRSPAGSRLRRHDHRVGRGAGTSGAGFRPANTSGELSSTSWRMASHRVGRRREQAVDRPARPRTCAPARAGQSGTSAIAGSNSHSATNTPSIPGERAAGTVRTCSRALRRHALGAAGRRRTCRAPGRRAPPITRMPPRRAATSPRARLRGRRST